MTDLLEREPPEKRCPNCHSTAVDTVPDDGFDLVEYHCDTCGHEWEPRE